MANLSKILGVSASNVAKVNGVAIASIANLGGATWPASGATVGYYAGDDAPGSTVDKLTMATETAATGPGALSAGRSNMNFGTVASADYAFWVAGNEGTPSTVATVDRNAFATDAASTSGNTYPISARAIAGLTSDSTKGWGLGGYNGSARIATAYRITFSTEAWAAVASANLSTARQLSVGIYGDSTKGYAVGGNTTGLAGDSTRDKLTTSTETTSALTASSVARSLAVGISDGGTASLFVGGQNSGTAYKTVQKTAVSTDTESALGDTTVVAREYFLGFSESSVQGWMVCSLGDIKTAEKYTHATDSCALTASADAPNSHDLGAGSCNAGF